LRERLDEAWPEGPVAEFVAAFRAVAKALPGGDSVSPAGAEIGPKNWLTSRGDVGIIRATF